MPEGPLAFEDPLSLHTDIRESLRQAFARNICPQCCRTIDEGYGSGQIKDGLFCSLECYVAFREMLINIIRPPERN